MLRQCLASRPYGHVNGMPDAAGGQADVAVKIIRYGVAEAFGHCLGLTGDQPVEVAPEARCKASRTSSSRSYGSRIPTCGRSVSQLAASARSIDIAETPSGLLEVGPSR